MVAGPAFQVLLASAAALLSLLPCSPHHLPLTLLRESSYRSCLMPPSPEASVALRGPDPSQERPKLRQLRKGGLRPHLEGKPKWKTNPSILWEERVPAAAGFPDSRRGGSRPFLARTGAWGVSLGCCREPALGRGWMLRLPGQLVQSIPNYLVEQFRSL